MVVVTFEPDGAVLEVCPGTPLLAAILRAGRPIGYACRGQGVCVSCRLQVWGAVSPVDAAEAALLARLGPDAQVPDQRIACLVRIEGDVRVRASYW
jgi:ferredoxin